MKTKAAIICTIILAISLSACTEQNAQKGPEITPAVSSLDGEKTITAESETASNEGSNTHDNEDDGIHADYAPVTFNVLESKDYEQEILDLVLDVQQKDFKDPFRFSEMRYFYSLNAESGGYRLFSVEIDKYAISYCYGLPEKLEKNTKLDYKDSDVVIQILRPEGSPDAFEAEKILKEWTESGQQNGQMYLTDENILYNQDNNDIYLLFDDTILRVYTPNQNVEYEYLRDLAFDVIKNAELVTVKD
ncbi:MAG: hypothetical protein FWG83_07080 [Oscillospiraceae bacterium]|nr:hypothetical protein [Oscillospiraceae bacterium]